MAEERFVRLRSLLALWPQAMVWQQICALFRAWPESAEKDAAIEYADAHLSSWPHHLRTLSLTYDWPTFPYGQPASVAALARSLELPSDLIAHSSDAAAWQALAESGHLEQIKRLVYSMRQSPENVHPLMKFAPHSLTHLEELDISHYEPEVPWSELAIVDDTWLHLLLRHNPNLTKCAFAGPPVPFVQLLHSEGLYEQLATLDLRRQSPPSFASESIDDEIEQLVECLLNFGQCASLSLRNFYVVAERVGHLLLSACEELPIKELHLDHCLGRDDGLLTTDDFAAIPFAQLEAFTWKGVALSDAHIAVLTRYDELPTLRRLALEDCDLSSGQIASLAAWAPLYQLEQLSVRANSIRNRGVRSLVSGQSFSQLTHLTLSECELTLPATTALAQTPHLPALQVLDLHDNNVRSAGARALASSQFFPRLKQLDLSKNAVYWTGYKAIAESNALSGLEELHLRCRQSYFEGESLHSLAAWELPPGLWELELASAWSDSCKPAQLEAFAKMSPRQPLLRFNLGHHALDEDCLKHLSKAKHLSSLLSLELEYCKISPEGAAVLAKAKVFSSLQSLHLGGNQIGDLGAKALASAPFAAGLLDLSLVYCEIGTEGLEALATSAHLSQLRVLDLQGNHVSFGQALALIRSPQLPQLASLVVGYGKFEGEEAAALQQEALDCKPWLQLTV